MVTALEEAGAQARMAELILRGVAGCAPDEARYAAQIEILKDDPEATAISQVYGSTTVAVAQSAVANVLPACHARMWSWRRAHATIWASLRPSCNTAANTKARCQ